MRIICFLFFFTIPNILISGPEHDHGESFFSQDEIYSDFIKLSKEQVKNLNIRSEKVKLLPISETIEFLAFTELVPEKKFTVSPRFEGKIIELPIKLGQSVKEGDKIVTLQPLKVGNKNIILNAPLNGFILNINAGIGEIIKAGGNILEIGDTSHMLVRGIAYETPDINLIKFGQKVEIHLDVNPKNKINGKIQRINRVIDKKTRTFSIYAIIETPKKNIQPGLQGTMEVFINDKNYVLTVPKKALLGELGDYFVYIIKEELIEKRKVVIGARTSHHVEIKHGLTLDNAVIVNGNYQLQYISAKKHKDLTEDLEDDHNDQEDHDHEKDSHNDHNDQEDHDHEKDSHYDHNDQEDHDHEKDSHDDHSDQEDHDHEKDSHDDH